MNKGRLIIISNRLPIKIEKKGNEVTFEQTSGGLVSAMVSFLENSVDGDFKENIWVGFPDCSSSVWKSGLKQMPKGTFQFAPVFLAKENYNGYYNGFSNSTIWPLFHYFPSFAEYNREDFDHYIAANQAFCDALKSIIRPNDTIWIHDYHLMLLPEMLRKSFGADISIGFFLHIPFPSYEIFRLLPSHWRERILLGILGSDLIGFHLKDYANYFSNSVQKILGLAPDHNVFKIENRICKTDYFPISIDFKKFHLAFDGPTITDLRQEIRNGVGEKKIIFSVDRLDYTKGLLNRLKAYRLFLDQNEGYKANVVFILNIVPSRDAILKYSERKKMVDEYVGNLNSDFGNINWQPVVYQYRNLDFNQLIAFYTVCDLALITPVRDGMNLVAKEFVASRKDKKGVLILSEMAGSAIELNDALLINPMDVENTAQQIKNGLELSTEEQTERMEAMQDKIREYDVSKWATDFLGDLANVKLKQIAFKTRFLGPDSTRKILETYQLAERRLILLDYDGTLVPFYKNYVDSAPSKYLLSLLENLTQDSKNNVFIISGRNSAQLDQWLGSLNLSMVAEHGAKIKYAETNVWNAQPILDPEVKANALRIMQKTSSRCPSAKIEEKEYSLVWHFRNSSPDLGKIRAAELLLELNETFANTPYKAFFGNKIIEFKSIDIHKGKIVKDLILQNLYDFILCIGDDITDEDMFYSLTNTNAWTIKVGNDRSFSRYNIADAEKVVELLASLQSQTKASAFVG